MNTSYLVSWIHVITMDVTSYDLLGSEPKNCSSDYNTWAADTSVERCSQEDWTVQAVGAIYMLFSNLLLVNLVIAMFR